MIIEVNNQGALNQAVPNQGAHASTGGVEPDPSLPVVVLVHGAGMDSTVWSLQTRYLAHRGFRVLAVDLPGHGLSEGDTLKSISEMAAWLGDFLEAAGVERAHLVGHSMGTFIALELAAAQPQLVTSLVLMGTAPGMPVHPQLLEDAEHNLAAAAALMVAWSHAKPAHVGPNPTPGLWMLGGARALVERSKPGVLASDFRACAAYDGALGAAAKVQCASTVFVGSADKMTPAKGGRALAKALVNSSVVQFDNAGHMMMIEQAKLVKQSLVQALS